MNSNKKKILVKVSPFIGILLMCLLLFFIFKDSYSSIGDQLVNTNIGVFILMIVLGNGFYIIDAAVYRDLFTQAGYKISRKSCLAISYMCIFFNVTTFGVGIKPGQCAYASRKGIDAGEAMGMLTMPYVFHKVVIVIYAAVMMLFNRRFVETSFSSSFGYIYAGCLLSGVIIVFILLISASRRFHILVIKLLNILFKNTRFNGINSNLQALLTKFRESCVNIIRSPKAWIKYICVFVVKMSCWYIIPVLGIYAVGGSLGDVTISESLTVTALMQLLVGVIPTSGGVGSLEVVFSLLFAAIFGKSYAGSCMVLYRLATYYIPFIISALIMLKIGKNVVLKKDNDNNTIMI